MLIVSLCISTHCRPSLALLVPSHMLGTAYGIGTSMLNLTLVVVPLVQTLLYHETKAYTW